LGIRTLKIIITKAQLRHLEDCKVALLKSKLGQEYFPSEEKARFTLTEGITKEEIFVAVDEEGECLGFIWFILAGVFHSFPYLHIITVKEAFRGRGIGKKLLDFFGNYQATGYSLLKSKHTTYCGFAANSGVF